MFTGIVQYKTVITDCDTKEKDVYVTFLQPESLHIKEGDSVLINGVCSTVMPLDERHFRVQYMAETMQLTTVGQWAVGMSVNIEASLAAGDPLGGHIVQGHIDGIGSVEGVVEDGDSWRMTITAPENVMRYIVYKGSIAVDGTSLTITACDEKTFTVSLIAHTMEQTNLGDKNVGDTVNLESDVMARYIEKFTALAT